MSTLVVICNDLDYFLRHRAEVPLNFSRQGNRVIVATGGRREASLEPFELKHFKIRRFAFNPIGDSLLGLKSFILFIRTRPDVIHLITLKPAIYSGLAAIASKALGFGPRKMLITIPGLGRLLSPSSQMVGGKAAIARKLIGIAMKTISAQNCTYFTFETEHDRAVCLNLGWVSPGNSTVIQGAGVDPERFHPSNCASKPPLKVLFASRLLRSKGLEAFLLAADSFRNDVSVRFLVAGMIEPDDPDGYSTVELAEHPAITFIGEETDMPALLRKVDVVCLPTLYGEGIPRILIEASASGLPSISTDLPGCNEIVESGRTGFLIPIGTAAEMSSRIKDIIDRYVDHPELLKNHSEAALARFQTGDFTQTSVTRRFLDLLNAT